MDFYLAAARGKGVGVFAGEEIAEGRLVFDYSGKEQNVAEIPSDFLPYAFQVDYDTYIVPPRGSVGWYINHSCNPNCVIDGRTRLVAARTIRTGEEVTVDYSTDTGWDGFEMVCSCREPGCRGTVKSYRNLDEETKKRYGRRIAPFLLDDNRRAV